MVPHTLGLNLLFSSDKGDQPRAAVDEDTPLLLAQPYNKMSVMFHKWSRSGRKLLVDVLAVGFGIGAWIAVNGLFVQLPLLVQTQPEGWNLPSFLSVIVQVANVGPLLYSVLHRVWPGRIRDSSIVYSVLTMGTVALLLLALFYKETTFIFGEERSTALFVLVFFISIVGCTSSVLFLPFMGNFREIYLVSYFVGEGLSGFLPSVAALIQGVGGNPTCVNETLANGTVIVAPHTRDPNFSTEVYFFLLFGISAVSTVCFFLLNNLPTSKGEKVSHKTSTKKNDDLGNKNNTFDNLPPVDFNSSQDISDIGIAPELVNADLYHSSTPENEGSLRSVIVPSVADTPFSAPLGAYLLFLMAWVSGLGNGVFPSIQSYSCLPYGNVVYHLAATLGTMANPAACFLAFFLPISSVLNISVLASISAALSSYIVATALMSPSPPLVNTPAGDALIVICWILNSGLIAFVKMSIASLYRRQGGQGLFWCGALQQIGSAVAALITFFLVNYAGIFSQYYPCQ